MPFEFDPEKSAINKRKHGVDFVEAQKLWADPKAQCFAVMAFEAEKRFYRLARFSQDSAEIWIAFFTMRGEAIRLISVRRAKTKERKSYEEELRKNR
jgi:uncharacterized protein